MPSASSTCVSSCPNRPKPITRTRASPLSVSSVEGASSAWVLRALRRSTNLSSPFAAIGPISMVSAASATAKRVAVAPVRPRSAACGSSTKANSPAGARTAAPRRAPSVSEPNSRNRPATRATFTRMAPSVAPNKAGQTSRTRLPSIDMPTLMKNRPSSMPRNGSISASS